ncbi:MAG: flavin reductase [Clostridia bacterium]|nr:flavin reductase [Clostridia bacterium]
MDEKVMQKLSYGLFVLTTVVGDKDNGCIVNTVTQITASPNRISVAVNKNNYTAQMILQSKKFTVSVLSTDTNFEIFERFGFQSGKDVDKFKGFTAHFMSPNGCEYISQGTNAYLCANVKEALDMGTHYLFIADVTDGKVLSDKPSCTYAYYHENIKPKPKKNDQGQTVWVCTICGYEYVGEELPDGFICPICKHPASDFEKITKITK